MEHYVKTLYQTLLNSLDGIPDVKNLAVKNPATVAEHVNSSLRDLKSFFIENPFHDQNAQIHFFKYEKPKFYGEYIYALELFTIASNKPHGEDTVIKNYYEQELRFIKRFFDQNRFLYQYYLLDGMEMDSIYFLPGDKLTDMLLPEAPDTDPQFSTPGDFLFSKFLAYERIQEHLINLLFPSGAKEKRKKILNWTGDKINLIEIAYGIYDTAQINHGDVDIVDIISSLEELLNVNLSRHYRIFSEMKNRKSVSPTRYLDHMSEMLKQHLTAGDAFLPRAPVAVSGSKSSYKK
ncbi:MAG: RteC domain-containing protein [Flavisolibacter sp.]